MNDRIISKYLQILSKYLQVLGPSNISNGIYYIDKTGRTELSGILPDNTYSFVGKPKREPVSYKFKHLQLNPVSEVTETGFKYTDIQTGFVEEVIFNMPQTMSGLVLIVENETVKILIPKISYDKIIEYAKRTK